MIKDYINIKPTKNENCKVCGTNEDLVYDDWGEIICFDCLFEKEEEINFKKFNHYGY